MLADKPMDKPLITYNGVPMTSEWPKRIEDAQKVLTTKIGGVDVPRVRFGEEARDWGADRGPCHDCGVLKGQLHVPGCDVERCPQCGSQFGACGCSKRRRKK